MIFAQQVIFIGASSIGVIMKDGKVLLIANPAAQRGNGAQAALIAYDLLTEWLGRDNVDMAITKEPHHATVLASDAQTSDYGTVLALGGDGLAHEVVNGLMELPLDTRPVFGLIPVGSGNDLAKTLGMSTSVPDAIVQFLDAKIVHFDIGKCNGVYFDETLSFGLDAAIALDTIERRKKTGKQGTRLYLESGIDQLFHHLDVFKMKMVLDQEKTIEQPIFMLAVQNGQTYGGGFRICPEADPTDGYLDICYAVAPMSIPAATFKFLMAKNAHHTKFKGIHFARAQHIELSFDNRPPCQIDGEPLIGNPYEIDIEHAALDVLIANKPAKK